VSPICPRYVPARSRERSGPPVRYLSAMPSERLLTTGETAERLSVSPRTVSRLVAAGRLLPVRFCGRLRFDPRDVEAFLERARGRGTADLAAVEPAGGPEAREPETSDGESGLLGPRVAPLAASGHASARGRRGETAHAVNSPNVAPRVIFAVRV
jgi:excisionase family DNA binding protein